MKKNYKILSLLILSVIVSLKLLAGTIKTNEENEQIFASKATAVIATGISKTSETTYIETFDLLPAEGWLNDNYILNNGISWAVNAKSEFKTRLGSGNSIYFFKNVTGLTSETLPNGISSFSLDCKDLWDPGVERKIVLLVNGEQKGEILHTGTEQYVFSVENINVEGDVIIAIQNIELIPGSAGNSAVTVDNITWTSYAGNPSVSVTGVSVTPTTLSLTEGETSTLSATVSPSEATDKTVSWTSDNTEIATVDSSGVVTAVSPGTINIKATTKDGSFVANCVVKVEAAKVNVTGVVLNKQSIGLFVNATEKLVATIAPAEATDKTVTWASTNNAVATVVEGIVTAVGTGNAIISVNTSDGSFIAECVVTVTLAPINVTGVTLNKNTLIIFVAETAKLEVTVTPANADDVSVNWKSSNETVATVVNGVVTAVAAGEATISATTTDGSFIAVCTVTVIIAPINVTGVTLDHQTLDVFVAEKATLIATVAPANADNLSVTWSSTNKAVATVTDGVVTAIAAGETTISVTTAEGNFTAECVVKVNVAPINVNSVSLNYKTLNIKIEETAILVALVTPTNADDLSVAWVSSNKSVADVLDGVVTGVSEGEALITVITNDGNYIDSCIVTVISNVGVDDFNSSSFEIYPNPVKGGILQIKFANNEMTNIEVYDILGKVMHSESINNRRVIEINTYAKFTKGVYFIKVSNDNRSHIQRILIQ